jgi:epoxyqueuosine reductase
VGKIARYAWGLDYHQVLRGRLTALGEWLARRAAEAGVPPALLGCRACADSAPLDERALAVRAGLGFIGKNTLLLQPDGGSFGVLGVLLLGLPLPPDAPARPTAGASCGNCRRCLEACPTGALTGPYQLDPRHCTSYLTIEQKEEISAELAGRMAGWAFGCDVCQEVCPFNAQPLGAVLPELRRERGAGPFLTELKLANFPSGKALSKGWSALPLARPGLKGLRRNLHSANWLKEAKVKSEQ